MLLSARTKLVHSNRRHTRAAPLLMCREIPAGPGDLSGGLGRLLHRLRNGDSLRPLPLWLRLWVAAAARVRPFLPLFAFLTIYLIELPHMVDQHFDVSLHLHVETGEKQWSHIAMVQHQQALSDGAMKWTCG